MKGAPLFLSAIVILLSGCATLKKHDEFVKTITFSDLQSYTYEGAVFDGLEFKDYEEEILTQHSNEIIERELSARGFEKVETDYDFSAVVRWEKAVSSNPGPFDGIDGAADYFADRENKPSFGFATRIHLSIEIFETETGKLFWRKDLRNLFTALELNDWRAVASLERAIENFPERVERDPNLPDVQ